MTATNDLMAHSGCGQNLDRHRPHRRLSDPLAQSFGDENPFFLRKAHMLDDVEQQDTLRQDCMSGWVQNDPNCRFE
ncbi:MAG: hypothetical protein GZ085_14455 [Sulfuriferula multivorans]|uniref:Uncharacterized protein n=1 Tax=Sulfuriferula multivorans TaxID=1559896 RepID=A0A7C9P9Q0_9PROT|nr:hypothetical protein [Sulfuriferula multivorans]